MKIYDGNARLEKGEDYIEYSGRGHDCDICGGDKADFGVVWSYSPEMRQDSQWEYYHFDCWNERENRYAKEDTDYEPIFINNKRMSDERENL